ncbi:hypothetical protein BKA62DRAFT_793664 [Auriculariales sp. MPI-PUGE-AT-0066]|nr:hypothetical protein BKA62DRAFT_793664 [Auriculariales sp. MPI-PUGE-AT-0066]
MSEPTPGSRFSASHRIRSAYGLLPLELLRGLGISYSYSTPEFIGPASPVDLLPRTERMVDPVSPYTTSDELAATPLCMIFARTSLMLPRGITPVLSSHPLRSTLPAEVLHRVRIGSSTGKRKARLLVDAAVIHSGEIVVRERRVLLVHLVNLDADIKSAFKLGSEHAELKPLIAKGRNFQPQVRTGALASQPVVAALRACELPADLPKLDALSKITTGPPLNAIFTRISLARHSCDQVNCIYKWVTDKFIGVLTAIKKIVRDDPFANLRPSRRRLLSLATPGTSIMFKSNFGEADATITELTVYCQ